MEFISGILFAILILGLFTALLCLTFKAEKKITKSEDELSSVEEKIVHLNDQLAQGIITQEEYKAQKAEILKNI